MGALSIRRCSVGYQDTWIKSRSKTKIEKISSLKYLTSKVSDPTDKAKVEELISVYLDAHDLTTRIGLEIAKYGDKYSGKDDIGEV